MNMGLRNAFIAAVAAAVIYLPASANAESSRWLPYPGHLTVHFAIDHNGLSKTRGRFRDVSAQLILDENKPDAAQVTVKIEAASLDTGFAFRDHAVRGDWFLNARKFRYITFKSTKITKTGAKTAKMTGDLTMHGVTKSVTLDVIFNKAGKQPSGADQYGFSAKGSINRLDWGITKFSAKSPPAITGEIVEIEISAEFVRQK